MLVGLGAAAFGIYPVAIRALIRDGGAEPAPGWSVARTSEGSLEVMQVDVGGPAAGQLQVGDRLLAFNDYPPLARGLGWVAFMDLRSGDPYTLRVARGGAPREYSFVMRRRTSAQKLWLVQVPLLLVSVMFCVTGVAVGFIRPADSVARLYSGVGMLVALVMIPFGVLAGEALHGLDRAVLAAVRALGPVVLPVVYHFFMAFPPGVPQALLWLRLKVALYLCGGILLPGAIITAIVTSQSGATAVRVIHEHGRLFEMHDALSSVFISVALIATVSVVLRNHVAIENVTQRRRLRLILWGSLLSASPFAILLVSDLLLGTSRRMEYFTWLRARAATELFLVFLPVTFAYAVVKHRVIGVDVVVRRTLQYLLARHLLQAALFLPVVLLLARAVSNRDRTLVQILFESPFSVTLAIGSAVALFTRQHLRAWLDRRFFRESYDREHVLLDLVEEIKHHDAPEDLARLVSERLERALHPTATHMYFLEPDGGSLHLLHPSSEERVAELETSAQLALLQSLGQRAATQDLGSNLAVPIGGAGRRLYGLLLLGPRRSEQPYSREDRRLLLAVASQIAIVCENSSLRMEAIQDAKIRHDVLARVEASGINLVSECPACGRCYDRSQERCDDDGTLVAPSLPVDRTIDRRYRLDRLLGRGGMASVYLASDLQLGRQVAIKLLKSASAGNEDLRRRFEREARTSARLHHPNIITIFDYGNIGPDLGYLVMERLVGTTLRDEMRHTGRIAPSVTAEWFGQILGAVAFAHASGIIHRDLKPENVFISKDPNSIPTLKVLDFGLAKLTSMDVTTSANLTEAGTVMGTLTYMSPEQLSGRSVDERTDIFALGVMVAEAVTGQNPFRRDDPSATVAAILHEPISFLGDAPEFRALHDVLQHCCAKNVAERFTTVIEMGAALLPTLRRCPSFDHAPPTGGTVDTL